MIAISNFSSGDFPQEAIKSKEIGNINNFFLMINSNYLLNF